MSNLYTRDQQGIIWDVNYVALLQDFLDNAYHDYVGAYEEMLAGAVDEDYISDLIYEFIEDLNTAFCRYVDQEHNFYMVLPHDEIKELFLNIAG